MTALQPFADHLWQSTLFAAAPALAAVALRRHRAAVRYALWLAASVKFLVPFSLLVAIGHGLARRGTTIALPPKLPSFVGSAAQVFSAPQSFPTPLAAAHEGVSWLPALLIAVWSVGFLAITISWQRKWRRLRGAVRDAAPLPLAFPAPALTSPAFSEPGVFGVFRPVLLLPAGIEARLSPAQFEAILRHEASHIRRRDNLATALHMAVEALFWFHPLVWWLGARLLAERERACDEAVIELGSEPQTYAEGILEICEICLASPLPCVAGVAGSNLKSRIETIVSGRIGRRLNRSRKAILAVAATAAIALPMAMGLLNPRALDAQDQPSPPLAFDSASIKVSHDPGNGVHSHHRGTVLDIENMTMRGLIQLAYEIPGDRIDGPGWIDSLRYDITAKAVDDGAHNQSHLRLQTLLHDRFKLVLHTETRQGPIYEITVGKKGPKMQTADPDSPSGDDSDKEGEIQFHNITMAQLAKSLERGWMSLGRPVIDKTGLDGRYTFSLKWLADENAPKEDRGAAIVAALDDQAGLKIEPRKGPVDFLVIDSADKAPVEN